MRDIIKLGLTLALICAIAAGGLAFTYAATRKEIARQIKERQVKAYSAALPGIKNPDFKHREDLAKRVRKKFTLVTHIFDVYENGTKVAEGIQVTPRGYGGFINMVVGIDLSGKVRGVSIISQNETPGLGSQITDEKFLRQFKGKNPSLPVEVNKDIDAISGATKSSKAVTKGVKEALEAFKAIEGK